MFAVKVLILVVLIFIALCIACAIFLALRDVRKGPRMFASPRPDPYSSAFGDVPYTGFTARQLGDVAPLSGRRDPLNRTLDFSPSAKSVGRDAGSGHTDRPSGMSAARNHFLQPLR